MEYGSDKSFVMSFIMDSICVSDSYMLYLTVEALVFDCVTTDSSQGTMGYSLDLSMMLNFDRSAVSSVCGKLHAQHDDSSTASC